MLLFVGIPGPPRSRIGETDPRPTTLCRGGHEISLRNSPRWYDDVLGVKSVHFSEVDRWKVGPCWGRVVPAPPPLRVTADWVMCVYRVPTGRKRLFALLSLRRLLFFWAGCFSAGLSFSIGKCLGVDQRLQSGFVLSPWWVCVRVFRRYRAVEAGKGSSSRGNQ